MAAGLLHGPESLRNSNDHFQNLAPGTANTRVTGCSRHNKGHFLEQFRDVSRECNLSTTVVCSSTNVQHTREASETNHLAFFSAAFPCTVCAMKDSAYKQLPLSAGASSGSMATAVKAATPLHPVSQQQRQVAWSHPADSICFINSPDAAPAHMIAQTASTRTANAAHLSSKRFTPLSRQPSSANHCSPAHSARPHARAGAVDGTFWTLCSSTIQLRQHPCIRSTCNLTCCCLDLTELCIVIIIVIVN